MKENNKGRGHSNQFAIRVLVVLGITCLALLVLCFVFRDSAPVKGITRRFMMGSPTKVKMNTKQYHYIHGAVATDNARCSKVGSGILKKGGSAVDAAIASMLCVGVINLHSTGIGGGGFMLVYNRATKQQEMIDFRETAPGKAYADLFHGNAINGIKGGLAVAVPGELRGMEAAWKKYGKLKWAELFAPAIRIARHGFRIPETLAIALSMWNKTILEDEGFRKLFAPGGKLLKKGDLLRRPQLARTLSVIARNGSADPFYDGPMSKVFVHDVRAKGGIVTLNDLKNYQVKIKPAIQTRLDRYTLITCPAPTAGPVLSLILNVLDGYKMGATDIKKHPVRTYHRIIETFKFAFKYRSQLADPDYELSVRKAVRKMLSPRLAEEIRHKITDSETHKVSYYGSRYHVPIKTGTTHLTVVSPDGDAVSVTSTVNGYFGAKFRSSKLGFVYNNEMDDFSAPHVTNEFGLPPSKANFIKPGKRPQSSAVPSIVINRRGDVVMAVGAAGGTIITTSVANVIMNYFWFKRSLKDAITMPRVHDQLFPQFVFAESKFPAPILAGLKSLGHQVQVGDESHGVVQGITQHPIRCKKTDRHHERKDLVCKMLPHIYAESDYRKGGEPAGF